MTALTNPRGGGLSRGKLAQLTGCHAETIRYYEKAGILDDPPRTAAGHRVYGEAHVKRLAFVLRSRELGFALEQVRELLGLADQRNRSCAEVKAMTLDHAAAIRDKIADLQDMERVLSAMAAECDEGDVPACPIIDTLYGAGQAHAPLNGA